MKKNGGYKNCIECGKQFYVRNRRLATAKWCSKECWSKRGITYYQRTCPNCTIQFETVDKRQNYCSKDCSLSVHLGDKSHLWKGGLTERSKIERTCSAYRKWRLDIFKRDNFTCVECGKRDRTIEAHHIKPQSENPELRYEIDNGITLCHECHKQTDNYGYKQRWGSQVIIDRWEKFTSQKAVKL